MSKIMMTWQEFITQPHADNSDTAKLAEGYLCQIPDTAIFTASGEDAATFLHGQLSNDVEHLKSGEARLAAYCTPKGRMLASFMYWKTGQHICLQLHASIAAAVQKRLQMFVMRSKVKLQALGDNSHILGLGGVAAVNLLQASFGALPESNYGVLNHPAGTLIRLPDAFSSNRYQLHLNDEQLQQLWPELGKLQAVQAPVWQLADILAGIPHISAATQEKFVPQMVNFELIGGVNFRKGCYPGQEIVARSQYLGKLKRRMFIATTAAQQIVEGSEIFRQGDASEPCGAVVNAVNWGTEKSALLLELKLADFGTGTLSLGSADGTALEFLPLPYEFSDITE